MHRQAVRRQSHLLPFYKRILVWGLASSMLLNQVSFTLAMIGPFETYVPRSAADDGTGLASPHSRPTAGTRLSALPSHVGDPSPKVGMPRSLPGETGVPVMKWAYGLNTITHEGVAVAGPRAVASVNGKGARVRCSWEMARRT